MSGKVEQVFLLFACLRELRKVLRVDDHMARRAGHYALASALERLACGPGDVEQPLSRRCIHFLVEGSVSLEETHQGHATSFSWAIAAAAIRSQASVISCRSV